MKTKTFTKAYEWFKRKVDERAFESTWYAKSNKVQLNFKENFKKNSCEVYSNPKDDSLTFISWSFENDGWGIVKQQDATRLVFRVHFKGVGKRKKLSFRCFIKLK